MLTICAIVNPQVTGLLFEALEVQTVERLLRLLGILSAMHGDMCIGMPGGRICWW